MRPSMGGGPVDIKGKVLEGKFSMSSSSTKEAGSVGFLLSGERKAGINYDDLLMNLRPMI